MTGVLTHVVTSAKVTGQHGGDSTEFIPLLHDTARRFDVVEVSADKAYLSRNNLGTAVLYGATPYIPFKSDTVPVPPGKTAWATMYQVFAHNSEEFMAHYHRRSNVESTFSMLKRKFGDAVRSTSVEGQRTRSCARS